MLFQVVFGRSLVLKGSIHIIFIPFASLCRFHSLSHLFVASILSHISSAVIMTQLRAMDVAEHVEKP